MNALRPPLVAAAALLATAVLAACSSGTPGSGGTGGGSVRIGDADNGKPVTLSVGQDLVLALTANPTTGYSWAVVQNGAPQLVQQGEPTYAQDPNTGGMAGAGGTSTFTFRAEQAGATTLTLNYARPFEQGQPPANTFSVPVTVQ
jgi:inhibitor of cysteine peptidase